MLLRLYVITCIFVSYKDMVCTQESPTLPRDWQVIENIIEDYPYVVALLDRVKEYICTGTSLNHQTVLTSGTCISYHPKFVATGVAIVSQFNQRSLVLISYTILHRDYSFDLIPREPQNTLVHSNLALVFVSKPVLAIYTPMITVGNYYASELEGKALTSVGYGNISSTYVLALQRQKYYQAPCENPKWYYCICGVEDAETNTYENEFGEGGPVFYGSELVGLAITPGGSLLLGKTENKYNIFTLLGPYMPWILKVENNVTVSLKEYKDGAIILKTTIWPYLVAIAIISLFY